MRKSFFLILLFISVTQSYAQPWNNLRKNNFFAHRDTILLDSLSIVPNSFSLKTKNGIEIDSANYVIHYSAALLILKNKSISSDDSVIATYRVFPYLLSQNVFHKDSKNIQPDELGVLNPFLITYQNESNEIFKFGGLNKSGSISRGISFGNNQDVVVNSSLNLQMSGKISDDIDVLAAITDENIPFQPEGNTQQLQEFDKVFIQLSNKNNKLIAGDYDLKKPDSHFMSFYKKAQGGSFTTVNSFPKNKNETDRAVMRTGISAAVSKGKYAKNSFDGQEGNQGPYRLTGANNELYIFVLSGSENVFINGMRMERGLQNDYTIDYNSAQIIFTPRRMITKDSRIVIEFQYSDLNYLRSLVYLNNEFEQNKWKVKFNFFSEQDSRNQPLNQKLSNDEKKLLDSIGDNLNQAIVPNVYVDNENYNPDLVHYKKIDSLVTGIIYPNIYVYSTDRDSAIYTVGFTLVGDGKGNYAPVNTATNGRVFKWIAPVAGIPQGSYEPVRLLVTPKAQQLYTLGTEYAVSKNTSVSTETALSNYNQNTFSSRDKKDNVGFAEKISIKNSVPLSVDSNSWKLNTGADYEFVQKIFSPIERFRSVEFERDWNLANEKISGDENFAGATAGFSKTKNGFLQYRYKRYNKGTAFNGYSNGIGTNFTLNNFRLVSDGSIMNSTSALRKTNFIRHKANLSKSLKYITIGGREDAEQNKLIAHNFDTLQAGSYAFNEWEFYLANADTAVNKFRIFYGRRYDNALKQNSFHLATTSENTGLSFALLKNPNNHVNVNSTFRHIIINDTTLTKLQNGNTLLNNIDHGLALFNGGLSFATYYEIGTGQEQKKEFAFLEVPAGQGTHEWIDINKNNVKELNEFFENLSISSNAKYVKVLIPTNEYVRTNTNQFSEVFNFTPSYFFENPEGFSKFISRISNQLLLRRESKTKDSRIEKSLNPFEKRNISDTSLVTLGSSFQDNFYFNRSSSKYGFDVGWLENKNKSLLTNGFETRVLKENNLNSRWNMTRVLGINLGLKSGEKSNSSDFFSNRDYKIIYTKTEPKLIIQTSTSFRIIFLYEYTEKSNTIGLDERSFQNKAGTEVKYSTVKKGTLFARFNYIFINYNALENSPIAYEMLEGLNKGTNYTWGLTMQRTLSSGLQLNINYEGRKTQITKPIHTGGIQLRAFF